jgi:hypothetical protein
MPRLIKIRIIKLLLQFSYQNLNVQIAIDMPLAAAAGVILE